MDLTNPQIIMRDKEIAQLRAENEKLAAALAAKDAALQRCTKFTQEDYDALDLKPNANLVRKLKAEAVTEFLEREEKWTINEAILAKIKADAVREFVDSARPTKLLQKLGHEYADRIERGEV